MTTSELVSRLLYIKDSAEALISQINQDIDSLSDDIEMCGVENEEGDF